MSIETEITRLQNAKADIKNAIESKGVTVGDGLIDTYAEKINEIKSGDNHYDEFWDNFQRNGTRTNYYYAFYSGASDEPNWNDSNYKPKYPIAPTNAGYMYMYSNISEYIEVDLTNCSNCTATLHTCSSLKKAKVKVSTSTGTTSVQNMFRACEALTDLEFEGVWGTNGLSLQWSPLTTESLHSFAESLADKSADTGTWKITLGSDNISRASADDLSLIESKGWQYL